MKNHTTVNYYISRKSELLESFNKKAKLWCPILSEHYGDQFAENVILEAKHRYEDLIPKIPYIGGEENHLTNSLIGSVECLAFYLAMRASGKKAVETGKVLYDSIAKRFCEPIPDIPPSQRLSEEELMKRRKARADRSQRREYERDFVYEFVEGDGDTFDYGYNFIECATQKFYVAQHAKEFLPFYSISQNAPQLAEVPQLA